MEQDDYAKHDAVYLLRTVQQHHVQLTHMADQKANFLLAGTFIAISVAASHMANTALTPALVSISLFSVISSVLAILAVIPRFKSTKKKPDDPNVLFFGTFGDQDYEEYWEAVKPKLQDKEDLYRAMVRDIYEIGCVLHRKKYPYIRWSYTVFLFGIVISGVLFVIERSA